VGAGFAGGAAASLGLSATIAATTGGVLLAVFVTYLTYRHPR
jgi:hypothetical protein